MDEHRFGEVLPSRLNALAERVERDSREGTPVVAALAEIEAMLLRFGEHQARARILPSPAVHRVLQIVEQLQRDACSGRVRSISGLRREMRRVTLDVDDDPQGAVQPARS